MLGSDVFERFVKRSPTAVILRAAMENAFSAEKLDALFREVAVAQYEQELLFSTLVDLMILVVCRNQPSMGAAYREREKEIPVTVRAVYDKLNGVEPQTSRELVRHTAAEALNLIQGMKGSRTPLLPGYELRVLDGNHLQGTEHRIKELRTEGGGALPGLCLAVLDPQRRVIRDAIPCEDAHTQECRLLDGILETVEPRDVYIADRHFCTSEFLFGLIHRKAFFIIRQHAGHLRWELTGKRKCCGRSETGLVYEQKMRITYPQTGETCVIRRITVVLDTPTRDGDTELHILTNLPARVANARKVAELYGGRWRLETAFQEMTVHLQCELNTMGYPPAALFGFCTAAACYNILAVLWGALRSAHGETVDNDLSNYYLTNELRATYGGMMIALPPEEWKVFQDMPTRELARLLKTWARQADLFKYRKSPRGPKKRTVRPSAKRCHFSTARLLEKRKKPRSTKERVAIE